MQDNSKSKMKWVGVAILAVVIVLAVVLLLPKSASSKYKNLEAFARCLTDKGAVMYGAYWCSHCKAQKAEFGASFKYIKYVECTDEPKVCETARVEGYPTWKIASTTLVGEQLLETLASQTSCFLERK